MTLEFNIFGKAKATYGTKTVYATEKFVAANPRHGKSERMVVMLKYYDKNFDASPFPMCCKSPSICKDRKSAERLANRFFKIKP